MSAPAPPPAPPPGVAPTLNADVDKLLADTDPDAANDKDDGAGSPAEPTGGEEKSGGNGKDGAAEEEDAEPAEPVEPIGEEFKPVDSRGCTDTLCCLLFLGCMALWCGVAAFVFYYGNPYSVIYGVDYEGSICSHSCGANTDPMSNCSAASIKAKKVHFPRITSTFLRKRLRLRWARYLFLHHLEVRSSGTWSAPTTRNQIPNGEVPSWR